ncbi:MAG: hypothetical protein B7Y99_08615 [Caulobacterales bacterium 32-69-10]|nr:MAG: hypothetical protein B7Y99_08615 [Caulobacterales bacterium 32-69-10]
MISPAYHDDLLRKFQPSLLISGTRDSMLSSVIFTHSKLVAQGVKADLHIFEAQQHCSIYFDLPESRMAWNVMTRFFDEHLGR